MMTWSINWDATSNCASTYQYAENFENIFGVTTSISTINSPNAFEVYPNPANEKINIESNYNFDELFIFDHQGKELLSKSNLNLRAYSFDVSGLSNGFYQIKIGNKKAYTFQKFLINH
jgi:hypothetical protein